jgi:D-glycero-D-manno-heptose 1,7-bisphosphate phosphatase
MNVLFLDRDGTIIQEAINDYITSLSQVELIPRADEAIALAKAHGFKIVMVSNQGAIARGLVSESTVQSINALIESWLVQKGGGFDFIYYAPSHPKFPNPLYDSKATWRKPDTGMVLQAIADFKGMGLEVDKANSFFIGDKQVDVECGLHAGLRPILVQTGYGEIDICREQNTMPEFVASDLYEAVTKYILQKAEHST